MSSEIQNFSFTPKTPILSGFEIKEYTNSNTSLTEEIKQYLTKKHRVDFYSFIYVLKGSFIFHVDFEKQTIEKDQVVFLAPDKILEFIEFSKDFKCKWVVFTKEFYKSNILLNKFEVINSQRKNYKIEYPESINFLDYINNLTNEYHSNNDFKVIAIQSILNLILIDAQRHVDTSNKSTYKLKQSKYLDTYKIFEETLEANYFKEHQVSFYCKALNISRSSLQNIMYAITGLSPKQCIIIRLLLEAKRDLIHSNLSIKEIAYKLGFKEESPFSNFFKKYQKQTPLQFRNDYLQY